MKIVPHHTVPGEVIEYHACSLFQSWWPHKQTQELLECFYRKLVRWLVMLWEQVDVGLQVVLGSSIPGDRTIVSGRNLWHNLYPICENLKLTQFPSMDMNFVRWLSYDQPMMPRLSACKLLTFHWGPWVRRRWFLLQSFETCVIMHTVRYSQKASLEFYFVIRARDIFR